MVRSMTGFGRSEFSDEKRNVTAEIKSVNHRYNDISVRMPRRYSFAEETIKSAVKTFARRGKIEVSVMVENIGDEEVNIRLNPAVAKQYLENIQRSSSQQDAISRVIKEQSAKEAAQIRQEAEAYSQKVHADADAYWKQVAARASKLLADQEALRQLIQSAGEVEINEEHSKSVP